MVTHLNFSITIADVTMTDTVCGNNSSKSEDGTNSTSIHSEVTCKNCLKIMNKPTHWRNKKYIQSQR